MFNNENNNPWKINREKIAYDNPWIRVTEYDAIYPAGGREYMARFILKIRPLM